MLVSMKSDVLYLRVELFRCQVESFACLYFSVLNKSIVRLFEESSYFELDLLFRSLILSIFPFTILLPILLLLFLVLLSIL